MALITPQAIDCVLAMGDGPDEQQITWKGSGFLYGRYSHTDEAGKKRYDTYIVSCRHVFEQLDTAWVRCNPRGKDPAQAYQFGMDGKPRWIGHPDPSIDIAVAAANVQMLMDHGMSVAVFTDDTQTLCVEEMENEGVTEGDHLFVLGFPLGLVGARRNAVITRHGVVARIRDVLDGVDDYYLVDAAIYPGNSGGPVLLQPQLIGVEGTTPRRRAGLIGVVSGYLPYRDTAVSLQTQRPRVTFEENSGLGLVLPMDKVNEAIDAVPQV
ncbi:hypothetical protein CMK11_07140 [Candidatus Poribacteria bacterium]|nr:hypothetical protein [Candidatus Poribacteria bacterium]